MRIKRIVIPALFLLILTLLVCLSVRASSGTSAERQTDFDPGKNLCSRDASA